MEFHLQSLLVITHVAFGTLAVLAGAIALAVKKGAVVHVNAGRLFAVVMIGSSALGAILGLLKPEQLYITFHAGILGVTLIASSWMAARSTSGKRASLVDAIAVVNLLNTIALISIGWFALGQTDGSYLGFAGEDYLFLAVMAGIAAVADVSLLFRTTLSNHHRIARHLWRMCFGFFIAAGSAFTGPGASVFPEVVQSSGVLSLPELFIFLLMVFWLARVYFTNFAKKPSGKLS